MLRRVCILFSLSFMGMMSVAFANEDQVTTSLVPQDAPPVEICKETVHTGSSNVSMKHTEKANKQSMKVDMASYKPVLKVLTHMMQELKGETCRGGQERVEAIVDIMNELVRIHKEVELGSLEKYKQLMKLKKEANEKSQKLDLEKSDCFNLDELKTTSEEVKQFFSQLQTVQTKTVGTNLFGEVPFTVWMLNAGVSAGYSKDVFGRYHPVILGNAGDGIGIGYFGTAGWNSVEMEKHGSFLSSKLRSKKNQELGRKVGAFGIGGGFGGRSRKLRGFPSPPPFHMECPYEVNVSGKNHIGEAGLGLGFFTGFSRFGGIQLGSLGQDYGYFMKNLGLTVCSGKPIEKSIAT